MEKILEQILNRLDSMDRNIGSLKSDVATLTSDVTEMKSDVVTLTSDVTGMKSDVSTLKSDVSTLKSDMSKFERKLDAVFEQTAGLLEFKTDVTEKLNQIIDDNISLQEIVGEHEVAIRSLRRRAI